MELLLILGVGLVAGTLSGIVGFGSSIMMLPVLVLVFGPREAVPVMRRRAPSSRGASCCASGRSSSAR